MKETIVSVQLPVQESLEIKKNRIVPPAGQDNGKRLCVVTGIHGDELEGQYLAYRLNRVLAAHPEHLHGTVDIYPAMNPLGINSITRGIPLFDLDMNRVFPGSENGSMVEHITYKIVEDIRGADIAIDIHASNIFLTELPQVRINVLFEDELVPLAKELNIDYIWVHQAATVLESTLAHSLNSIGTKCLVVEMGVGMRLTRAYGDQLLEGILNLMKNQGMWTGETKPVREPIVGHDEVAFLNAEAAGIFIPEVTHNCQVEKGQLIGVIADPLTGSDEAVVTAPESGLLFTLRDYPVVYPGSLLGRILTGGYEK